MNLLAIDIGGTRSRFAHCYYQSASEFQIEHIFETETCQANIKKFQDLLAVYEATKPNLFLSLEEYKLISIAIAGPVNGRTSTPPNIAWDIDLDEIDYLSKTYLINDFVAQAYAFLLPDTLNKQKLIRSNDHETGAIAIIGAGTGLGHCMLARTENGEYEVFPSEAGQACFPFNKDEKNLELFVLDKTRQEYVTNDLMVSGSGLSLIHEFLTSSALSAEAIFTDTENNLQTLKLFSRLYGRACRNYCLSSYITGKLIITGGIAAKHPELIDTTNFLDEFENSSSHRSILRKIAIYLNKDENIGLLGAANYALIHE